MNRSRPIQHTHNWRLVVKDFSPFVSASEISKDWDLAPYSPGGFYARRYWACIRGNKIKHITVPKHVPEPGIDVFIAMSGVYPERI